MTQSARKLGRESVFALWATLILLFAAPIALSYHLTALAIVLFVLLGSCFIAAIAFGMLTYRRGMAEVDQIVREAKATQRPAP